ALSQAAARYECNDGGVSGPAPRSTNELGLFLRARRAEVHPTEVGVVNTSQSRRVQGLRREEVAQLAMISADYYTRLEQGRVAGASPAVLDALAAALRLGQDERS